MKNLQLEEEVFGVFPLRELNLYPQGDLPIIAGRRGRFDCVHRIVDTGDEWLEPQKLFGSYGNNEEGTILPDGYGDGHIIR